MHNQDGQNNNIFLVVGELDVDRDAEAKLVNIKEGDMGGGDGPGELNRICCLWLLMWILIQRMLFFQKTTDHIGRILGKKKRLMNYI